MSNRRVFGSAYMPQHVHYYAMRISKEAIRKTNEKTLNGEILKN